MMNILKEKKRWFATLLIWIITAAVLSGIAPHAKEVTSPNKNAGLPETDTSVQAEKALKEYFPSSEGVPLFVVVHDQKCLKDQDIKKSITNIEKAMTDVNKDLTVVPLSKMPEQARASFFSGDHTTFFLPVLFPKECCMIP